MAARWPASSHLRKKTALYYSSQRGPYWPFCLFYSETCAAFDWFYSNYYCLWSTITTPPMLSLEVNESSDLTAFDWTTLKWKLPEKIKVSQFGALYETNLPARRLCYIFHTALKHRVCIEAGRRSCRTSMCWCLYVNLEIQLWQRF